MGRGPSKLQRFILKEAAVNGLVFVNDIKAIFFGLPTTEHGYFSGKRFVRTTNYEKLREHTAVFWRREAFSPAAIGKRKYNAVSASISRALRRLRARGLLELHCARWEWPNAPEGGEKWRYGLYYLPTERVKLRTNSGARRFVIQPKYRVEIAVRDEREWINLSEQLSVNSPVPMPED